MEGVKLNFTPEAIREIARLGIKRETGARGLRSIMEEAIGDLMYEIPSMKGVEEVTITDAVISSGEKPVIKYFGDKENQKNKKNLQDKASDDENRLIHPA